MNRPKAASIECRPEIVGKTAANDEHIFQMGKALARDKGVLTFDLKRVPSEADRIYLCHLAKRYYGLSEIGGPK